MSDTTTEQGGLGGMINTLRRLDPHVDDAVRIDRIRALEELKAAAAAAQARETAAFAASQRTAQAAAGLPAAAAGKGVAHQVGLARRISPHAAARYVGWATILTRELPATYTQLAAGRTSEWRAMLIARESVFLSRTHRAQLDTELAPQLEQLGDKRTETEARKISYRLDPEGFTARARHAETDRHVSLRPAPDTMARLSALVPVAQGVACLTALSHAADSTTAAGDHRGRGQIMADTLVQRLTGQTHATDVPISVHLVMPANTLLHPDTDTDTDTDTAHRTDTGAGGLGDEPAHLDSYGPLPAQTARDLIHHAAPDTPMWIRRLYTAPHTGELLAMDSRQRCFTPGQRHFIQLRDQYCRTPYCEAPIRHTDHITAHRHGGPTRIDQGQGTCEACNYTKETPGWNTNILENAHGPNEVEITTPTRHRYRSRAPDPPGRPTTTATATATAMASGVAKAQGSTAPRRHSHILKRVPVT